MRIVTWNLQGAYLAHVDAVAECLSEFDADIVCLQEVQRRQYRRIRRVTGMRGEWAFKHWPVRRPSEGLAILSRSSIASSSKTTISRGERFWSWRRRIAIASTIGSDADSVAIVNTHLGAGVTDDDRSAQAERIIAKYAEIDFVVGDLNVKPDSEVLNVFAPLRDSWDKLNPGQESPFTNWEPGPRDAPPVQRLDYVLVSPHWRVVDVSVPRDWKGFAALSDHLPVIVEVVREPDTNVI